ncbi:hypothetical protein GCM10022219_14310 [Microbacterium oryzae]|uniref:Uncharacterized protein n=1 Tax=Microbacterium oryzae TaxID=743009 RepID=A0A6I6E739_9MICO|nr:hypothetical protein [Microbacterium oryzae]QGU28240.1 hypothetical protein D7D94_11550 [Microbacterium oryzae]
MAWRTIELRLDRDSVAMGDDMSSHARVTTVARGTRLSTAIEQNTPEIRSRGWSWVVVVDGQVSAVWSVDEGVRLLVPDRALRRGPVEIHFRYFLQMDPAWLFDRLAGGARADREQLHREYAPIARERYVAELRRREREIDARLLSAECVEALRQLGADITLHADIACDFTHRGEAWAVRRADTMFQVFVGGGAPTASIRPHALGEAWLVGMLGASQRAAAGLPDLPAFDPQPGLELTRRGGRWMSQGATVVQVSSETAALVATLAFGRSIAQVRALLEV